MKPKGFYVEFNSVADGAPLVGVLTGSHNRKTGDMVQFWILDRRQDPVSAVRAAEDGAICGECPQRHSLGGGCYVVVGRAPLAVWRAWKRGVYQRFQDANAYEAWRGARPVRLGAYGDPAFVPHRILEDIVDNATGWTAYTHQWAAPWAQHHKRYCMASVESRGQAQVAQSMGWRTFRTTSEVETRPNEFECPASEEQGKRLTCEECLACNGNPHARAKAGNVAIRVHGAGRKAAAKVINLEPVWSGA